MSDDFEARAPLFQHILGTTKLLFISLLISLMNFWAIRRRLIA